MTRTVYGTRLGADEYGTTFADGPARPAWQSSAAGLAIAYGLVLLIGGDQDLEVM